MKIVFLKIFLIVFSIFRISQCSQYAVAYIFRDSRQQRIPQHQISIYTTGFYSSYILINQKSRKQYKNRSIPRQKEYPKGSIKIDKSPIPLNMWIDKKQIILVQIDIRSFPLQIQQKQKYINLFKHKGQSFYIFNSGQISLNQQRDIALLFNLYQQNKQICKINLFKNTLEVNKQLIEKCYKENEKRLEEDESQIKIEEIKQFSYLNILGKYAPYAIIYLLGILLIIIGHPFWLIKKNKKQTNII